MQMSELKGRTPDIVRKEIVMMAITYNAVKALMCRAGKANSVDVSRISFAGTVSQICHWTCNFSGKIPLSGLMNLISLFNDSLTDHKEFLLKSIGLYKKTLRVKGSAPDDRLIFMGFIYTIIRYSINTISRPALYLGMMERRISPPASRME